MSTSSERRYVTFRDGLTLPEEPVRLALSLEARGCRFSITGAGKLRVESSAALTDDDLNKLRRWKLHVMALVSQTRPGGREVQ